MDKREAVGAFTIFPVGKDEELKHDVASIIKIIRESGLKHELNAMSTVIEGSYDEIMHLVKKCFEASSQMANRVYLNITIDWRKNREDGITEKVKSVENILAEK